MERRLRKALQHEAYVITEEDRVRGSLAAPILNTPKEGRTPEQQAAISEAARAMSVLRNLGAKNVALNRYIINRNRENYRKRFTAREWKVEMRRRAAVRKANRQRALQERLGIARLGLGLKKS